MNENFIDVDIYSTYHMSNRAELATGGKSGILEQNARTIRTFIRLDAFIQIDELEEVKIMRSEYSSEVVDVVKTSRCFLNRLEGRGINGFTTLIYLTEESYNRLIKALRLYWN